MRYEPAVFAQRVVTDPAFRHEVISSLENRLENHRTPRGRRSQTSEEDGVSVIVPTYRGKHRIAATLDSLAAQDLERGLFEIVVVVNGPDDGTAALLERYRAEHPELDIRVLRSSAPGAGLARNLGLAASRRAYVTFVDDDDVVERSYLSAMLAVAGPTKIVTARLVDVHPDGTTDETTAMSARLRELEAAPGGTPLAEVPGILGLNACKLLPRRLAVRWRYDPDLGSGEDVAYMANLLTEALTVVPSAGDGPRAYLRTVRESSLSRRRRDFQFSVRERLEVVRRLEAVDALPAHRNALTWLVRAQAAFVSDYLKENPDERDRVRAEVEAAGVTRFPWHILNKFTAKDLAIVYCFAPFLDPSGVVAAKALAERGRVVDVITADMGAVRERDPSVDALSRRLLDRRAIIKTNPVFTSWSWTCDFARKAAARAHQWATAKDGGYETLYTRALWAGSHVAGALFKLDHPDTVWTAEFSDPLARGIDARRRPGALEENDVTERLREALHGRGVAVPEDITLFEFVELVTYALADDLVFTNENQRDYMVSLLEPSAAELALSKARVRPHPTPVREAYEEVGSRYWLRDDVVNLGYFGSFYGNRTLHEVLDALSSLDPSARSKIRLHVFCNKPQEFAALVASKNLTPDVHVNPYLSYMEFLNASTRFDVLIVQDALTSGTFPKNPFLPSKYSDYRGAGAAVWGIVEDGSPLSARPLEFISSVGDVESARQVLAKIADLRSDVTASTSASRRPSTT